MVLVKLTVQAVDWPGRTGVGLQAQEVARRGAGTFELTTWHWHFDPVPGSTLVSLLQAPPGPTWPLLLPQVVQVGMSTKPSGCVLPLAPMLSRHLIVTGVVNTMLTWALLHWPLTRSAQPLPSSL